MALENAFFEFTNARFLKGLMPDFVLAFTFFTALSFAVLSKRFEKQRAAIAMSASLGLSLAAGLVWWENHTGLTINNLGPVAIALALLVLAGVIYQAVKTVGGSWAGVGITIGVSILLAGLLGVEIPIDRQLIGTFANLALFLGILAFVFRHRGSVYHGSHAKTDLGNVKHDMRDLYRDYKLSRDLGRRFDKLQRQSDFLPQNPNLSGELRRQFKEALPAEGVLTERLAVLRAHAHRLREGHVARIKEIKHLLGDMPPESKRKLSGQLATCYKELGLDIRLERLDKAVAATEQRIRKLTKQAEKHLADHDYGKVHDLLNAAAKLQKHNTHLLDAIERTEARLLKAAGKSAQQLSGVTDA